MFESIEALIFDCDGTLVDSMPAHFVAWQAVAARYGISFTEQRFYELAGVPSRQVIQQLAAEQGVVLDIETVVAEREMIYWERIEQIEPIPSVVKIASDRAEK